MTDVYLEMQTSVQHRQQEFVERTATGITEGYGAGNCSSESVAFWMLNTKVQAQPGWVVLRIELDGDDMTDRDIAAAVSKVTDAPAGEIQLMGRVLGRWQLTE